MEQFDLYKRLEVLARRSQKALLLAEGSKCRNLPSCVLEEGPGGHNCKKCKSYQELWDASDEMNQIYNHDLLENPDDD